MFWIFLCRFEFFALPNPSIVAHLATGVALVSAGCVISVFRMPSWKNTAKLLDAALGLNQRIETSFECIPARDEMDTLLLQDTSGRIASIRPAEAVPLQFSRTVKVFFFICLLSIATMGIIRILHNGNLASIGKSGNAMQPVKGSLPQAKNPSKSNPAGSQADNLGKSQSFIGNDSASGSGHHSSKDAESTPEQSNPFRQQSAQGPRGVSTADRGASDSRGLASATTIFSKPKIMPEPEKRDPNLQPGKLGDASEGNKPSSRGGAAGDNFPARPDAGAASIRKAERAGGGQSSSSALSGTQANPGGKPSAGQAGILSSKPIPSGNNAASQAERSLDYPALWPATERALAKEIMPPGLKSYIAEYFKAIHP
jgi:hypothetical protein